MDIPLPPTHYPLPIPQHHHPLSSPPPLTTAKMSKYRAKALILNYQLLYLDIQTFKMRKVVAMEGGGSCEH